MSETWYSADHHFGNKAITGHIGRKGAGWDREFESPGEMDAYMIECWNTLVQQDDIVYYLGDFTLLSGKRMLQYLDRLQGRIRFVPGGHDMRWMKDLGINRNDGRTDLPRPFHKHEVLTMIHFQHIQIPTSMTNRKKQLIVLSHYPQYTWERSHHGSWHLHGHSHGGLGKANRFLKMVKSPPTTLEDFHQMDVGVDPWEFYPVHLHTVIERMDKQELPE